MKYRHARGIALVWALASVVLLTVSILAFFSKSMVNRQIAYSGTHLLKTDQIGRAALDLIVADVRQEIIAGSNMETIEGVPLYLPKMAGDRMIADKVPGDPNLVRISDASSASSITTSTASLNGRKFSDSRWAKTRLSASGGGFTANWMMLTRAGAQANPANPEDKSSPDYVLGRYAYAIYDEGGLLNANWAGAPGAVSALDRGNKTSVIGTDLVLLGVSAQDAIGLADWRASATGGDYLNYVMGQGPVYGLAGTEAKCSATASGFSTTKAGDNAFFSRKDLIRAVTAGFLPGLESGLPYLGTFNYELNTPSAEIAGGYNFKDAIDPATKQPLQRFPLRRLQLLEQNPAALSSDDATKILDFFGLTPATESSETHRVWNYKSATISSVGQALTAGRRPDLFELVYASIENGSLGVLTARSTNTSGMTVRNLGGGTTYTLETNAFLQVAAIIANIIDQADADHYPTTIVLGNNRVHGIENLPYINKVFFKSHFPSGTYRQRAGSTNRFYFELWNPHLNAPAGPVSGFPPVRIVVNPEAQYALHYRNRYTNATGTTPANNTGYVQSVWSSSIRSGTNIDLTTYRSFPDAYTDGLGAGIDVGALDAYANPQRVSGFMELDPPASDANILIYQGAYAGPYIALLLNKVVFALQFQDAAGVWHTYSTFAGAENDGGNTGLQNTFQLTVNSFTDANSAAPDRYSLVFPKPDPRTFRFRGGVANTVEAGEAQPFHQHFPKHYLNETDVTAYPMRLFTNTGPESSSYPTVRDYDNIARVADGYLGANPFSAVEARPVILDRPFRSVGELGNVFRDSPWKSLNFFSEDSPDLALLDLFSVEEGSIVQGKTNLNRLFDPDASAQTKLILEAMVGGVLQRQDNVTSGLGDAATKQNLEDLAGAVGPFENMPEMLAQCTSYLSGTADANYSSTKSRREAIVRGLASGSQWRTWNLLIDVVVQSGQCPKPGIGSFLVQGERRYWLHVSIDRLTGRIIKQQLETIYE